MSKFLTCCLLALLTFIGPLAHAQSVPEAKVDLASVTGAVTETQTTTEAAAATETEAAIPAAMATVTATVTAIASGIVSTAQTWEGKVSYLASKFTGRKTASGERFNPNALTMAHKTLPFGTMVRVTNLRNGKSVHVRVTDRGPFIAGRVADLSLAAAHQIDMVRAGVAQARLEVISVFE